MAVVMAGQPISFTVSLASGDGPFFYQWQKNGADLVGAMADTYTLASVVLTDAGSYAVVVTNVGGSVTSTNASLTVNRGIPIVTDWPTATAIAYGQTLASSTLSGGSVTPAGSFAFTVPDATPAVGTSGQSVTFTPTDMENYGAITGLVNVTRAMPITFGAAYSFR